MDIKLKAYLLVIILVTSDQNDGFLLELSLSASSCKDRHSHTYADLY